MLHARRIYVATSDEARAVDIGAVCISGRVEGWLWFSTLVALVEAIEDGARPLAIVIDHLSRAETIAACSVIRSVAPKVRIFAAFNGDSDPNTPIKFRLASAWIPRAQFLRLLPETLDMFKVTR